MKWLFLLGSALGVADGAQFSVTQYLNSFDDNATDDVMSASANLENLEEQLMSLVDKPTKGHKKNVKMSSKIAIMITRTMLPGINKEHRAAQSQLNSLWRAFRRCGNPARSRRTLTTYALHVRAKRLHRNCRFRQAKTGKLMSYWCRLSARRLRAKRFACRGLKAVKRNPAVQARKCRAAGATRYGSWLSGIIRHFAKKRRQFYYFKARCGRATKAYNAVWPRCRSYRRSFRSWRRRCYSRQTALDLATCGYRAAVKQSCYAYRRCYSKAWRAYLYRRRLIQKAEKDRKIQYRVLKRIGCLLKGPILTGKAKGILACRKKIWSTRHLNLRYPKIPRKKRCTPSRVPMPCSAAYRRSAYGRLPLYGRAQKCRGCARTVRRKSRKGRIFSFSRRRHLSRSQRPVFAYNGAFKSKGACYWRGAGARLRLPLRRRPYTLEAWIKPDKKKPNGGIIGWGRYGRKNQVNAFRLWGNKGLLNYWWANDLGKFGLKLQNNRWHHVAATYDGKLTRRIFYDFRPVAYRRSSSSGKLAVSTKKNFCVGKTYGKEYFKGWMSKLRIYPVARSGSLMKAGGKSKPVVWMRGYRCFKRNRCLMRKSAIRAAMPYRRSPYTIEARIKPSRRTAWSGGIVGYGLYRRRNSVNAFRIAGRDGIFNYYWGNDLFAHSKLLKKYGRRLHDGRYHHVAATFDGWYQRIYVDYRVVAWKRTTGPVSLAYKRNFCIGKTYGKEYFRGRMGNVKIYRWARQAADMRRG